MPYKSDKQRKFFHTDTAKKAGITKGVVEEFDEASKDKELPERVHKKGKAGVIMEEAVKAAMRPKKKK